MTCPEALNSERSVLVISYVTRAQLGDGTSIDGLTLNSKWLLQQKHQDKEGVLMSCSGGSTERTAENKLESQISIIMEVQSHFQLPSMVGGSQPPRPVWVSDLIISAHHVIISSSESEPDITVIYSTDSPRRHKSSM